MFYKPTLNLKLALITELQARPCRVRESSINLTPAFIIIRLFDSVS